MSNEKRNIIIITDGDTVASHVVQEVARQVGGRCISRSSGNPTPLSGEELVRYILEAQHDPVLVMFDDNGHGGYGHGEKALHYVANHPQIHVLGAIAVASNTGRVSGAHIDVAVDADCKVIHSGVNKDGEVEFSEELRVFGDTVDVLDHLHIPLIVGIGDIGKMHGKDHIRCGCPVTKKAVEIILSGRGSDGSYTRG